MTREIREPHGWGMRGDIACLQANYGMNFWDFSDVTAPKPAELPPAARDHHQRL